MVPSWFTVILLVLAVYAEWRSFRIILRHFDRYIGNKKVLLFGRIGLIVVTLTFIMPTFVILTFHLLFVLRGRSPSLL